MQLLPSGVSINVILCSGFLKVRQSTDMAASQTENEEVKVAGNAAYAYELTQRYQAARQPVVSTEEPLYEIPL